MKKSALIVIATAVLQLAIAATGPAQQPAPADPREACRLLIERSRMTEKGQMLLQRLMRATETPALMDRLVHMADSLGGGDVVAGLGRIVETVERVERQGRTGGTPGAPTR